MEQMIGQHLLTILQFDNLTNKLTLLLLKRTWLLVNAVRAALGCLGFSNEAAVFIADAQQMNSLAEFETLKDEEVENLCKVTRRPGGTIANPLAGGQGQPATIPDPGVTVSLRAENNLKLACHFLHHRTRVSRAVTATDITTENVRTLRTLKDWEEDHDDVETPEINSKDWPRTIESIEEWLRGCLGVTKIPLACVIRDTIDPPDAGDDPDANHASKQDELIARAPVRTVAADGTVTCNAVCSSDRTKAWEPMSELTRGKDCWTHVQPAQ